MDIEKEVNVSGSSTGNNDFSISIEWVVNVPDAGTNKKVAKKIIKELEGISPVISASVGATLSALETMMAAEFHKYFDTVITKHTGSVDDVKVSDGR